METDGTDGWSFGADDDMATVTAFPDADTSLAENLCCFNVVQQGTIAFFVVFLDGCHTSELLG